MFFSNVKSQDSLFIFTFPDRNKFDISVKATVQKQNNNYFYNYKINSALTSEQNIAYFIVFFEKKIRNINSPPHWNGLFNKNKARVAWGSDDSEYDILPGSGLDGYGYQSEGLPSIQLFLSRAFVKIPPLPEEPDSTVNSSIFDTSKMGKTISPKAPPDPFIHTAFLDTLVSYTQQSYELQWINNENMSNKYIDYFNNTKTFLQNEDSLNASLTLQTLLQDVEQDSGSVLISEVYALLRYNTEYLLEKLPQIQESGLPVKLIDSQGQLLEGGSLQYYEGGWKEAVDHGNGIFSVDTEKETIKLRMTYAYASQDLDNVVVGIDTAVFQTMAAEVHLKNSQGELMDEGTVKYYSGGWRDFGVTSSGVVNKELLPNSYKFRMTYAFASNDLTQNIADDPAVVFQTVPVQVELRDSQDQLMEEGAVKYYSGGWRDFGVTSGGVASKELLPNSYKFCMTYAFASNDLTQDVSDNTTVVFQTVPVQVELRDSQGQLMDEGSVKYYAGGWRDFGVTSGGVVTKELLSNNYKFRMTYAFASNDLTQNIGGDPAVVFQTVPAQVELRDSQGQLMDEGTVKYYAGGWRDFGITTQGTAKKELLSNNYKFRMTYSFGSIDKTQDIGTDPDIPFSTVLAQVRVSDQQDQPVDNVEVKYYSGGWRNLGITINGEAEKQLLPLNYKFRITYIGQAQEKQQNLSENSIVEFQVE